MKEYIQFTVVFAVLLVIIPCLVFLSPQSEKPQSSSLSAEQTAPDTQTVKIYFTKEKQVREYPMQDYLLGAVMAQTPADFEPAALQAQAVLAYTYALQRLSAEASNPTADLCGAALSDDTTLYHGFFTPEQAKALYKNDYDKAREKVLAAITAAKGKFLAYNGKPIIVAFHAVSDGHTRSAKDVWSQDIPYLTSVESKPDETLKQALSKTELTSDELKQKLSAKFPEISFTSDPTQWLKVSQTGEYALVKTVSVCGKEIPAADFCSTLDLASQSFSFECNGGKFIFTCKGLGHLVGLSQLGANEMAKQGATCEQILAHYFPACTLTSDT